jgi:hypothetical protein
MTILNLAIPVESMLLCKAGGLDGVTGLTASEAWNDRPDPACPRVPWSVLWSQGGGAAGRWLSRSRT